VASRTAGFAPVFDNWLLQQRLRELAVSAIGGFGNWWFRQLVASAIGGFGNSLLVSTTGSFAGGTEKCWILLVPLTTCGFGIGFENRPLQQRAHSLVGKLVRTG
jgi:hypothetical protein